MAKNSIVLACFLASFLLNSKLSLLNATSPGSLPQQSSISGASTSRSTVANHDLLHTNINRDSDHEPVSPISTTATSVRSDLSGTYNLIEGDEITPQRAKEVVEMISDRIFHRFEPLKPDEMLDKLEQAEFFMPYLDDNGLMYHSINIERISRLVYLAKSTGCYEEDLKKRSIITGYLDNIRDARSSEYINHFNKIYYERCIQVVQTVFDQRVSEIVGFDEVAIKAKQLVEQVKLALAAIQWPGRLETTKVPNFQLFQGALNYMQLFFVFDKQANTDESIEQLVAKFSQEIEIHLKQTCQRILIRLEPVLKLTRLLVNSDPRIRNLIKPQNLNWLYATNICSLLNKDNINKRLLRLALRDKYSSLDLIKKKLMQPIINQSSESPLEVREDLFIMANIMITGQEEEELQLEAMSLYEASHNSMEKCSDDLLEQRLKLKYESLAQLSARVQTYLHYYNSLQVTKCLVQLDSTLRQEFSRLQRNDANNLKVLRRVAQSRVPLPFDQESVDITTIKNAMDTSNTRILANLSLASYLVRKGVKTTPDIAQLQTKINKYLAQTFDRIQNISRNLKKKILILNELDSNQYELLQPNARNLLFDLLLWDTIAFGHAIDYEALNELLAKEQPTNYNCFNSAILCDK